MNDQERESLRRAEAELTRALEIVRELLRAPAAPPPAPSQGNADSVAPTRPLIVLDPGHGGDDPGAVARDAGAGVVVAEKDVVLPYAMALRKALLERGYDVALTRDGDTFISLTRRAEMANEKGALCLVSLHLNAASSESSNGAWVIYDDATSESKGKALAACIFKEMSLIDGIVNESPQQEIFPDGSSWVGNRQLTVLSKAKMPAVLVELGFITNRGDLAQLREASQREKVVQAIASGIVNWHNGGNQS